VNFGRVFGVVRSRGGRARRVARDGEAGPIDRAAHAAAVVGAAAATIRERGRRGRKMRPCPPSLLRAPFQVRRWRQRSKCDPRGRRPADPLIRVAAPRAIGRGREERGGGRAAGGSSSSKQESSLSSSRHCVLRPPPPSAHPASPRPRAITVVCPLQARARPSKREKNRPARHPWLLLFVSCFGGSPPFLGLLSLLSL
jgi:hypothetical protein